LDDQGVQAWRRRTGARESDRHDQAEDVQRPV